MFIYVFICVTPPSQTKTYTDEKVILQKFLIFSQNLSKMFLKKSSYKKMSVIRLKTAGAKIPLNGKEAARKGLN